MKVSVSGMTGRFYCPGCRAYHTFEVTADNYNGDAINPTIKSRLVYADGGNISCSAYISVGRVTFGMESRHRLAGQTVDLPDVSGAVPK